MRPTSFDSKATRGIDEQRAQHRSLPERDETLVGELLELQCFAVRHRMPVGQDRHDLLGGEPLELEAVAVDAPGHGQEGDVELVRTQPLGQALARLLVHRELDLRVAPVVERQQQGQIERPERLHGSDRHPPRADARQLGELGFARVDLRERSARALDEDLPGLGERRPPRGAVDEREADLGLEPADLLRERGLRDVLTLGSAREVALVGERDEVAQLSQLHSESL